MNPISSILNLQSNSSISDELASRQLEVITKAYQFLSKPENNIIYIADEVGLGKTYVALGIAILFRHFSTDIDQHRDLIIVPKKNLQQKWKNEIRNFVSNNYKGDNEVLKMQLRQEDNIKERLMPVNSKDPVTIFRMTSFSSIGVFQNRKAEYRNYLVQTVFNSDSFAQRI